MSEDIGVTDTQPQKWGELPSLKLAFSPQKMDV